MAESVHEIMERLEHGEEDAWTEVFRRFANRLKHLARTRLNERLRQKVDASDVVLSVFRTFCRRQQEGEFTAEDWDSLWSLLALITLRKCGRQAESFQAACRDVRREVSPQTDADDSRPGWEAQAREPSPVEAATGAEIMERLMDGLNERQQLVLSLKLNGCTVAEIADQMGRTERTVHRILAEIRKQATDIGESLR